MPGPFDKFGLTKADTEGFADLLRNPTQEQLTAPAQSIFEDFVFGEIRWDPADQPNVADVAKAFTISAGTPAFLGFNLNGEELYADEPVYHPRWWERTDEAGHAYVSFMVASVALGKSYVLAEFAHGVSWTTDTGTGSNIKLVNPRRGFTKEEGAMFIPFEVVRV